MSVVVLMYHRLGQVAVSRRQPGEDLYALTPARFARQLGVVAAAGLPVLPFSALTTPEAPVPVTARAVSITFDDGNASDFEVALPLLLQHGFRAAFFITAAFVGTPGYLDWAEVRELRRYGMTIGAHGWDHRPLSSLGPAELARQLREPRRLIAARIGAAAEFLSLPGGAGNPNVVRAALDAGYLAVAGSVPRRWAHAGADDVIPRYAMRRTDSLGSFGGLIRQDPSALRRAWMRFRFTGLMRGTLGEPVYQRLRRMAERAVRP